MPQLIKINKKKKMVFVKDKKRQVVVIIKRVYQIISFLKQIWITKRVKISLKNRLCLIINLSGQH
jgi:hypothetical protein